MTKRSSSGKRSSSNKRNSSNKRSKPKRRLSKWVLPTLKRSTLKKLDRDTLEGYAKLYKVKGFKKLTDKELISELSKFIPSDKIKKDYGKCIKSHKIGKYPKRARNNTSKAYQKLSLKERVKYTNRKVKEDRKKHKKEIDDFRARSRKAYEDCNTKRKKQYEKQIKDKSKTINKKTSKRYYKRTNKNKVYKKKLKKYGGADDGERREQLLTQLEAIYPYLYDTYGEIKDMFSLFSEPEKDKIEGVLSEIETILSNPEKQGNLDTLETFVTRVNKTYSDLYSKLIGIAEGLPNFDVECEDIDEALEYLEDNKDYCTTATLILRRGKDKYGEQYEYAHEYIRKYIGFIKYILNTEGDVKISDGFIYLLANFLFNYEKIPTGIFS